jgi:hypothetical protein
MSRVDYSPTEWVRANNGVKHMRFISRLFNDKPKCQIQWETGIMPLRKIYYDPEHPEDFGSVQKLVKASKNNRTNVEKLYAQGK